MELIICIYKFIDKCMSKILCDFCNKKRIFFSKVKQSIYIMKDSFSGYMYSALADRKAKVDGGGHI